MLFRVSNYYISFLQLIYILCVYNLVAMEIVDVFQNLDRGKLKDFHSIISKQRCFGTKLNDKRFKNIALDSSFLEN